MLAGRTWLAADRFTVADLLMADVLRVPKVRARGVRPASEAYVARVTDRPAFRKAHADQLAHFRAADAAGWGGAHGGNMDTAIAIRTAVIKDGELHIQAGAGVVYDSIPELEWKETMNKGRAIFRAVALAEAGLDSAASKHR